MTPCALYKHLGRKDTRSALRPRLSDINCKILDFMFSKKSISFVLLSFFAGSIGAVIGVLTLGKVFFDLPIKQSIGIGILIYAALVAIYVLNYVFSSLIISVKKRFVTSVWGTAIIIRDEVFAEINSVRRLPFNEDASVKALRNACNEIKKFYDVRTGAETSVSIKIPIINYVDVASMEVKNLCRDSQHFSRDNDVYKSVHHNVVGNTAYSWIVSELQNKKKGVYYFNNDIENTKDYRNTSKNCHPDGRLPYQSEIVVPIIPALQTQNNSEICGFLCLDCTNDNAFSDETGYDIAFLTGIADGIYDLVKSIITQRKK